MDNESKYGDIKEILEGIKVQLSNISFLIGIVAIIIAFK